MQTKEGPSHWLARSAVPAAGQLPRVPVHSGWRATSTTFRSFFPTQTESGPEGLGGPRLPNLGL